MTLTVENIVNGIYSHEISSTSNLSDLSPKKVKMNHKENIFIISLIW